MAFCEGEIRFSEELRMRSSRSTSETCRVTVIYHMYMDLPLARILQP
jgi:hypothetical protein